MFDGNNIIKEFRDDVERLGMQNGFRTVVISTDNHSRTGISPKIGYKPVGSMEDRKKVMPYLQEVFQSVCFQKANPSYSKNELIVRTMGKAFFDEVEKAFRVLGEKALYLLGVVVFSQLIIAFLLGLLVL
jgi:putative membrane protein